MSVIHAIFENGVFRPTGPVDLAEATEVTFEPRTVAEADCRLTRKVEPMTPEERQKWFESVQASGSTDCLPPDSTRADIDDEDEPR